MSALVPSLAARIMRGIPHPHRRYRAIGAGHPVTENSGIPLRTARELKNELKKPPPTNSVADGVKVTL